MKKIFLFLSILLFIGGLCAQNTKETLNSNNTDRSHYLQKILLHMARAQADVKLDNEILWKLLLQKTNGYSKRRFKKLVRKTAKKIKKDRKYYKKILKQLNKKLEPESRGNIPLRTSLYKLIGLRRKNGILYDAVKLSKELKKSKVFLEKNISEISNCTDKATVLKTFLIYANAIADAQNKTSLKIEDNVRDIRFIYKAQFPPDFESETLTKTVLTSVDKIEKCYSYRDSVQHLEPKTVCGVEKVLYIPNSGYIFGGNAFNINHNLINKGTDCTSFLAWISGLKVRFSTFTLEYVWKFLKYGEDYFYLDNEKEILEDLKQNWGLTELLGIFEPIEITETLQHGDIVFWRCRPNTPKHCSNHAVMFIEGNNEKFLTIELMRNKFTEGVSAKYFNIYSIAEEKKVYVLRIKND